MVHFFLILTKPPPGICVFLLGPQSFLLVDLAHIEGDSYAPEEPVVVASVASTFSTSLSFNFGVSELLSLLNSPNKGAEYAPDEPEPVASLDSSLPTLLYFFS